MMWYRTSIKAQAGFLSGYGDQSYMKELETELWEVDKEYKGNYFIFEVQGDSMDDNSRGAIIQGDRLLCRELAQIHWRSKLHIHKWVFVIAHKDEGIIIKQIIDHNTDNNTITLHSLNPLFEDLTVSLKDVVGLFNVVDLKRNYKL